MRGDRGMLYIVEGDPVGASRIWPRNSRWGTLIIVPARSSPAEGETKIQPADDNGPAGDVCSAEVHSGPAHPDFLGPSLLLFLAVRPACLRHSARLRCRAPGNFLRLVSGWVRLG